MIKEKSLNILFISNSTCYYFTNELYGLLAATGYEYANLCLVYYSGCSLKKHYDWWLSGEANYQFHVTNRDGRKKYDQYSLEKALQFAEWDIISFDNNALSFSSGDVEQSLANAEPYFGELYKHMKERRLSERFFWHEVWANEIGYTLAFKMETVEQRCLVFNAKKGVARIMQERYGVEVVPTGDAWELVRDMEVFKTPIPGIEMDSFTLSTRVSKGRVVDDFSHDGDLGGGRYLNACVWFEVITGKSCVGNLFRPQYIYLGKDYSLTEEKIKILQNSAHQAVEDWYA